MAGEFEEVLKLTIEDGAVSDFVSKVMAAFSEISDGAKRANDEGESRAGKGATASFRQAQQHVTGQVTAAGLSDIDTRRFLSTIEDGLTATAKKFTAIDPNFRTNLVPKEDRFLIREQSAGQARESKRSAVVAKRDTSGLSERDQTALAKAEAARKRNSAAGYLDVNEPGISAVERATRSKINSATYNNAAAGSSRYQQAALVEAIGLKRTNTAYNNTLAGSGTYRSEFANNEISQKTRSAAEDGALSTKRYGDASAAAAAALLKRQTIETEGNTRSDEYNKQLVRSATSQKKAEGKESQSLAESPGYNTAFGSAAKNAKLQEASENAALTTKAYGAANAKAATSILSRQAGEEAAKTASAGYVRAQVGLTTTQNQQAAKIAGVKGGDTAVGKAYQASVGNEAVNSKLQEAAESSAKNTQAFAEANAQAASAALELKNALEEAKTGSQRYIDAEVGAANELLERQTNLAEAKLADGDYVKNTAEAAVAMAALKAAQAEAIAATSTYADEARTKVADQRQARKVTSEVLNSTTQGDINQAGANAAEAASQRLAIKLAEETAMGSADISAQADLISAQRANAASLATLQAGDVNLIESTAQLAVAQDELKAKVAARVSELKGGGAASGKKATLFQRAQASFDPNPNADPLSKRTLGQFAGQHAANTLGYAIPGIAFGVGIEELSKSIQEAQQAQVAFAELNAQFKALGQTNQLAGYTQSIKDIASNTGLATSEVADLALAMKGVYGNTTQATIALQGVTAGAVAMGLSVTEAQEDLTGITQSFTSLQTQGGKAVVEVTNQLLTLQDHTGVEASQLAQGLTEAGPTANQVGLSPRQTASLLAAAGQVTGGSISQDTLGQTLSKVLDGITQNFAQILSVYQQDPKLQSKVPVLEKDTIGQAAVQIIGDLKDMPVTEADSLYASLGINASAKTSLAAFEDSGALAAHLNTITPNADRTAEEEAQKLNTLSGSFDRLRSDVINLGVGILDSGFGTSLVDFAKAAGVVVGGLGDLNKATGGLLGKFVEAAVAFEALKVLITGLKVVGSATGILKKTASPTGLAAEKLTGSAVALSDSAGALVGAAEALSGAAVATKVEGGTVAAAEDGGLLSRLKRGGKVASAEEGGALVGGEAAGATVSLSTLGSLPVLIAGFASFEGALALLNGPLKGLQAPLGRLLSPAPKPTGFNAGDAVGIKLGTDPYSSSTGSSAGGNPLHLLQPSTSSTGVGASASGFKGSKESKTTLAQQAPLRDRIEAELNASKDKLTKQQQYSITTDEKYANAGDGAAWQNLEQLFGVLGGGASGVPGSLAVEGAVKTNNAALAKTPQGKAAAAAALKAAAAAKKAAIVQGTAIQAGELTDFTGVQTGFEAGSESFGNLVTSANETLAAAQAAMAPNKQPSTADFEALESAIAAKNAIFDQVIASQNQEDDALTQVGNLNQDKANVQRYANSVAASKGPAAKLAAAGGIVTSLQAELQTNIGNATSLSQQQQIQSQGVTATPQQLAAYNAAQKKNHLAQVSSLTVYGQAPTDTSTLAALNQNTQAVQAQGVAAAHEDPVLIAIANYNAAVATLGNDVAAGYGPGTPQYETDAAAKLTAAQTLTDSTNAVKEGADSLAQAKAAGGNDAVAAAQAGINLAQQQLADAHGLAAQEQAEAGLASANQTYANAVISLMSARSNMVSTIQGANGDQVGSALTAYQGAVATANAQAAADRKAGTNPLNDATYLTDVGNESTTGAAYAQSIVTLATAKAATASALANEQGDPVQAALITYQNALATAAARAQYDVAHNVKPQNDTQYQADIANAYSTQAASVQAQISNLESIGQTELFLGQITATQYIAQLEGELAKVKGNKVETEQLLQEIRQVQNSAGGNLDFDIPSNLLIKPTVYQAERATQAPGTYDTRNLSVSQSNAQNAQGTNPVTVNDNKKVTVIITIGNGSHTDQAVKQLLGALGAPTNGALTGAMPTTVLASR